MQMVLADEPGGMAVTARQSTTRDASLERLMDVLFYLLVVVVLGALAAAAYIYGPSLLSSAGGATGFFGAKAERRLDVVEQANVDGRRRLVIIRRDDVEHLIMTGGPVDVVIETGIQPRRTRGGGEVVEAPQAVFSRPARSFGTAQE